MPWKSLAVLFLVSFISYGESGSRDEAHKHMAQLESVMRRFDKLPPSTQKCEFECPEGKEFYQQYEPKPFNCKSIGIEVDVDILTDHFTGIKTCCLEHDICYGRCGKTREECDQEFEHCLKDYCATPDAHRHDKDLRKSCDMASKVLWKSAYYMGCNHFIDAKKRSCFCASKTPHIEF